jgi:hypothetical protein
MVRPDEAIVEAAAVKSTKSPGMHTTAVGCGVSKLWLRDHSREQQRSCDACQSPSYSGSGSILG